jgi:hypothetical protein
VVRGGHRCDESALCDTHRKNGETLGHGTRDQAQGGRIRRDRVAVYIGDVRDLREGLGQIFLRDNPAVQQQFAEVDDRALLLGNHVLKVRCGNLAFIAERFA